MLALLPRWTVPPDSAFEAGSRDPLGFQRYATRFADRLLPYLTVLTTRARYYSFLVWALDEIALAVEPRLLAGDALPFEEYTEILARFERFLAFGEAVWHGPTATNCAWIGKRRSRGLVRGARAKLPLDVSLTVQEGTSGALADYRQSMQGIGLLTEVPSALPDELTDTGHKLADEFRRAVRTAKANRVAKLCLNLSRRNVDHDTLADVGKWFCLSVISNEERKVLRPRLLDGMHQPVVAELRHILRRAHEPSEAGVLRAYLQSSAPRGVAFELKQIAIYQVFALSCLNLFNGLRGTFEEAGQEKQLDQAIGISLKQEGILPTASLRSLIRHVDGLDEIEALSTDTSDRLQHSLRLLAWLARRVEAEPSLLVSDSVDSVSLSAVTDQLRRTDRRVDELLELLCARLVSDHQRVFASRLKRPWLSLSSSYLRLEDEAADPPLRFPPNSVRLDSLISIFRDLEVVRA